MWIYIVISILIFLALLVNLHAVFYVSYIDGNLEYYLKYTFFKIYSNVPGKKNKKKKKRKLHAAKSKSKKNMDSSHNDSSSEKISSPEESVLKDKIKKDKSDSLFKKVQSFIEFVSSAKKGIYRLIKGISFSDLWVDFTVADEDAYECAMKFGTINAAVYNIIGFISSSFKTKIKKVNIGSKYNNNNSIYNFSFNIRLKLGTGIIAAAGILLKSIIGSDKDKYNLKSSSDEKDQLNLSKEYMKMNEHPVNGLMGTTIEKLRDMIDVNTIIGDPISTPEGATIIPVSKVSFGFASGGSDLPAKQQRNLFGGAAGAGMSIQPLAFICVSPSGEVKLLQMSVNANKENAMNNTIPNLIDKISDMVASKDQKKTEKTEKSMKSKKTENSEN